MLLEDQLIQYYNYAGVLRYVGSIMLLFRVWKGNGFGEDLQPFEDLYTGEARLSCKVCPQREGCYRIVSAVVSARRNAELSTFFLYAACLPLWCSPLINHLPSSCSESCTDKLQSVVISYSGADKSAFLLSQLLLHKQPH